MTKIDADNLHLLKTKKHKDCDWYDQEEFECTNWRELTDGEDYAILECFKPIGTVFKNRRK